MKTILEEISQILADAFVTCGYEADLGKAAVSNRPDLCEFQCNGAMAGAKRYKKAPIIIAKEVVAVLEENERFSFVEAVPPGFINIKLNMEYLNDYTKRMASDAKYGCQMEGTPKTIVVDYGGANVAKPLHIGHLRPAVIGEAIKRLMRFFDNHVIADVHLGDWGLQMGLIIEALKDMHPELPYFDEQFSGEYPTEAPCTIDELEAIYPAASARSKEDPEFMERAHRATFRLQNQDRGYCALWKQFIRISVADLKKNYGKLEVSFDLWKGESDAQPYIPDMLKAMKESGLAYESQGALVMDVMEETDTKEIPPILLMKSDGAFLYPTTDLATLVQREADFQPDQVIYVVDKRQDLHFVQVFRCSKKAGIVPEKTKLTFIGNGTMNGSDGKPFKTRSGGVMRLEMLIDEIRTEVCNKMKENKLVTGKEMDAIADAISISALKYGDLSNQASKDYIFDIDRFTSFDGDTGPYILYTIVRIKSILQKYYENTTEKKACELIADFYSLDHEAERDLYLMLVRFNEYMQSAYEDLALHRICSYIFELANRFNKFYHDTKILSEENKKVQAGYIALITLTKEVLEQAIDVLGFHAPDRM